jgi:hypothetical protein
MLISCLGSESWSAISSPWVSLCGWMMSVERCWKGMTAACGALAKKKVKWRRGWVVGGGSQGWDDFFIAVEGGSRVVWRGWLTAVVWIQYFGFGSREKMTGWSIAERWSGGNELVLAQWEGNVTRHAAWWRWPKERRHRGGEKEETMRVEMTWILLVRKMKKIHVIDSAATNGRWRFKAMMS